MPQKEHSVLGDRCLYSADNDPLYRNRIRLLQSDPERYFEVFPPPKFRFGSLGHSDT